MTQDDLIDPSVYEELQDAMGEEFAAELLETFLADAPNLLADLMAAVAENDADGYRRASHSIKSNAQTFGATSLADTAKEMELSGVIDADAAKALHDLFDRTAGAFRAQSDE